MKRDAADLEKISYKPVVWSPFSTYSSFGFVTVEEVNVQHEHYSGRSKTMHQMIGQSALTLSFGRSCK